MNQSAPSTAETAPAAPRFTEDLLVIVLGLFCLILSGLTVSLSNTVSVADYQAAQQQLETAKSSLDPKAVKAANENLKSLIKKSNPLASWIGVPGKWSATPVDAFYPKGKSNLPALLGSGVLLLLLFSGGLVLRGERVVPFVPAFLVVFLLTTLAFLVTSQELIESVKLEYALWALLIGLIITNTVGLPKFLKPAVRTEYYIKTGLVLYGAEILIGRLLELGVPGLFVAWVVTPVVLVGTYLFGQYVLKIESKSLNMVVSADMAVCGVSAAIATAAACKAKKEELSAAISISLMFTVLMMIVMPQIVLRTGMNDVVGGAWIGGTVDSTGAVTAAGGSISPRAGEVAITVKMIQNMLIGVVSLCVATYWVRYVERTPDAPRPGLGEIWRRFPKFVLGFLAASIICSLIAEQGAHGKLLVQGLTTSTGGLRNWCFCLAFVSIGLDTNFTELAKTLKGGKPLVLYVCGQTFNLILTFAMAWVMYTKVFPQSLENPFQ